MSNDQTLVTATPSITGAGNDEGSGATTTDVSTSAVEPKGMIDFFRKRYKSGGMMAAVSGGDGSISQTAIMCEAASTTDVDTKSLAGDRLTADIRSEYGYYHTVSSSDARVLKAALAKERVPIFRRSESKARRSMAGTGARFSYAKERTTEGEMAAAQADSQSIGPSRADSRSFRDIFLRRRNRSDRLEATGDAASELKPKSGSVKRMRNFLVSFRPRPRFISVSYAPVDAASAGAPTPMGGASATAQSVGKKKRFKVTPANLLPGLKRSEQPARFGPEDFVEMFHRSRTTSDPRSDAILKAKAAASLHKVNYRGLMSIFISQEQKLKLYSTIQ